MSQLANKVAIVTGGGSGIGLAIAKRFVAEGAYVFITGRRQELLEQACRAIGSNVEAVPSDITHEEDLDRLFERVKSKKGRLDIFIANAGSGELATLSDATQAHFDAIFDLNVRAVMLSAQRALPLMSAGGTMVLMGSIAGAIGTPGYGVYGASKAALRAFARTWTSELAGRGIRVNTLSPGPIETPMFDKVPDEFRESIRAQIPLGRLGRPEEVAAAALFLASPESSFIAGAELCIDGGLIQV